MNEIQIIFADRILRSRPPKLTFQKMIEIDPNIDSNELIILLKDEDELEPHDPRYVISKLIKDGLLKNDNEELYDLTTAGHELVNSGKSYKDFLKNKAENEKIKKGREEKIDLISDLSIEDLSNSINYYKGRKKRRFTEIAITILIAIISGVIGVYIEQCIKSM